MDDNIIEIAGFKSVDEIFREAESIGDVKSSEGKKRAMLFLLKALIVEHEFSFETTLSNGLRGFFSGYFSIDVKTAIEDAFIKVINDNQITESDYFQDGKLLPGKDETDSIIGNAVVSFSSTLHYGYSKIKRFFGYDVILKKYTEEEVIALENSCKEYARKKEAQQIETSDKIK